MISILVVDDHEVVRQGLRFALEQEPDFTVVGECADGRSAIDRVATLRPDVMLLDMVMPGLDGMAVLHALRERGEPTAVIVLTSFPAEDRALDAVRAGATSYLSKTTAVDRVVAAVRAAAGGGSLLDPDVAGLLVRGLRAGGTDGPMARLSARERDVLALLSRGRSNREIARALALGEQTVKSYVSSILTKLDLQDRTQAAIYGLQQGLVPLGDALSPPEV